MPELPTGTVTFLFTDLEGSTRLWEEHPEAMRARSSTTRSCAARGGNLTERPGVHRASIARALTFRPVH
jgi:class 3 adenylate cyclase